MRRPLAFLSLAALLVAVGTTVYAQGNRHVRAEFAPLAASGISGDVSLMESPAGGTKVLVKVRGLEPSTEYVAQWYQEASCGTPGIIDAQVIGSFTTNPAGIAVLNENVNQSLTGIGSVSVLLRSDASAQACATIPQ
jgi:hypothetical protein